MSMHKVLENNGFFEFSKVDFSDANGSKTYGFNIKIKSHEFSASLDEVWFYQEDLADLLKVISDLISGESNKVQLRAMSDFSLTIQPIDGAGHFAARFKLRNSLQENSAALMLKVETQFLVDFSSDLKSILLHNS